MTNREVSIKYVVYELNNVMGSERHKALEKVEFEGWQANSFDTEDDVIKALIKEDRTYEDFLILKTVRIE